MSGRWRAPVAGVLLASLVAGCGGGPERADDAPASAGSTPSAVESVTGLPEPTETVEPATGPELEVEGVRVHAPEGWKQVYDTAVVDAAQGRGATLMLSVASTGTKTLSLAQAERYFWGTEGRPKNYEKQDDTVLGEVSAGHYTWHDQFDASHAITAWDSGYVIKVELGTDRSMPEDQQEELLASVLASFEGPTA